MDSTEQRHRVDLQRAKALTALVDERLPMDFNVTGDADAWPLVGAALLSRATSTLHHVFDARGDGQSVDAATLARSLYEHVVHLAWLAANPSAERIEGWRKVDLIARLKADTDARTIGEPLFDDQARAGVEAQVAGTEGPDRPLNLADLAIAADKHWAGNLPGMAAHTERDSFRGLYAVLYRNYSSTAHPKLHGTQPRRRGHLADRPTCRHREAARGSRAVRHGHRGLCARAIRCRGLAWVAGPGSGHDGVRPLPGHAHRGRHVTVYDSYGLLLPLTHHPFRP